MNHCHPPHPIKITKAIPSKQPTAKRVVRAYLPISTWAIYKRNEVMYPPSSLIVF